MRSEANLRRFHRRASPLNFEAYECSPELRSSAVETKWQARWVAARTNEPDIDRPAPAVLNLMMFPYPSAEGLHVGNMFAFTGADIYGRFKRLQGHDVFEPIGFDAFGIHSEITRLRSAPIRAS